MSTKRTPLGRRQKSHITPEAIAAFRRMEVARSKCTCPTIDWDGNYWDRPDECPTCEEWWAAHSILHDELGLLPHAWPAFEYPDEKYPYPAGCFAAQQWKSDRDRRPEAFELYRALKKAAT